MSLWGLGGFGGSLGPRLEAPQDGAAQPWAAPPPPWVAAPRAPQQPWVALGHFGPRAALGAAVQGGPQAALGGWAQPKVAEGRRALPPKVVVAPPKVAPRHPGLPPRPRGAAQGRALHRPRPRRGHPGRAPPRAGAEAAQGGAEAALGRAPTTQG